MGRATDTFLIIVCVLGCTCEKIEVTVGARDFTDIIAQYNAILKTKRGDSFELI